MHRFGADETPAISFEYTMAAAGVAAFISGAAWNFGSTLKVTLRQACVAISLTIRSNIRYGRSYRRRYAGARETEKR
jgi:hypothetical protein